MRVRSTLHRHKLAFLAGVAIALQPSALLAQDAGETVLNSIQVEAESDDILVQDGYVAKADRIGTKVDTPLVQPLQHLAIRALIDMHLDPRIRQAKALENGW